MGKSFQRLRPDTAMVARREAQAGATEFHDDIRLGRASSGFRWKRGESPIFRSVFPVETMIRPLPGTIGSTVHWKFREAISPQIIPEGFMAIIPQGRVWGPGYVITPDNVLLDDVSRLSVNLEHVKDATRHPLLAKKELVPPRQVGRTAVLATFGGRGFYHWIFDSLPRIEILLAGGIDLGSIEKFYVNECVAPFQFATLEAVGIRRDQLLQSHWVHHVQASELLVPSHVGEQTLMPKWACKFLKETLLTKTRRLQPSSHPARFYLTRKNSTHRKLSNEEEVIGLLQKRGFTIVFAENYSMQEQAELFASAEVIIGVHGAGFSNLVFCEPGIKVIEIFHPQSVHLLYWTLSHQVNLQYFYFLGEGEIATEGAANTLNQQNLTINLHALDMILEKALSQ